MVTDAVIKENAGYIKSIRHTKQWQQWIRRNCGSSCVWWFQSHLLPWTSLPSLAASSHIVPIVPKHCSSMPGGASNRHVLCLSPNEQWKEYSSLYFQKQEYCLHQAQWCLAQACEYKLLAHHLFWLRYSVQTNKTDRIQWGQSEMQRSGFPLIFTHFTRFFLQLYLLRQIWLLNNTGLGSESEMCRHRHLCPEVTALYHLSTANLPCCFKATLIQPVTSASDIVFTLQELKTLGILSALFTLKHEKSMNI